MLSYQLDWLGKDDTTKVQKILQMRVSLYLNQLDIAHWLGHRNTLLHVLSAFLEHLQ